MIKVPCGGSCNGVCRGNMCEYVGNYPAITEVIATDFFQWFPTCIYDLERILFAFAFRFEIVFVIASLSVSLSLSLFVFLFLTTR